MTDWLKIALEIQADAERRERESRERAQRIVEMLRSDNAAARAQAEVAVERACRAEEILAVVVGMPSAHDLMTNAEVRAMYEMAGGANT